MLGLTPLKMGRLLEMSLGPPPQCSGRGQVILAALLQGQLVDEGAENLPRGSEREYTAWPMP